MSKRFLRAFGLRSRPKENTISLDITPLPNGFLNLPLELWLEIFSHAVALWMPTRSISTALQDTRSTYHALRHDKSVLSDTYGPREKALLAIRRNIILVCKAWYQLGISTLYSHVVINISRSTEKLNSLYQSVKRHSSLASLVVRLSITDGSESDYNTRRVKGVHRILAKLLPLLTNVRTFTTPATIIRDSYSVIRPEVVIINHNCDFLQDDVDKILTPALQFATQVHALSFTHTMDYSHISSPNAHPAISFPPLNFPNLVNLQLQLEQSSIGESALNGWNLQRLQTLSITCKAPYRWMDFVRRHAENLEALEIIPASVWGLFGLGQVEKIRLPKLTKLCIYLSSDERNRDLILEYIAVFTAPRLVQLCYRMDCMSDWFFSTLSQVQDSIQGEHYLKELGDKACEIWPTMRELSFSYSREWSYERTDFVARSEESIKREQELEWGHESGDEDTQEVTYFRVIRRTETEAERMELLRWLVDGWVEDEITIIMKHRQTVELVFPRKSEGGMAAMIEYRTST